MRGLLALVASAFALVGCPQIGTGTVSDGGPADEPATSAEAGVVGAGCGLEPGSGIELCVATSACPEVVVDTQAMPSCGFRLRGGAVDLVCACGTWVCPMGVFASCEEAAQLLDSQLPEAVCVQVTEGRCSEAPTQYPSEPSPDDARCDRECLRECGGGAACASVCNCD